MLNRWVVMVLTSVVLCATNMARGEDFGSSAYRQSLDPAWGVSPTSSSSGVPVRPKQSAYGEFSLGVPLVMNVDRDVVRPGANLRGEGGLDLGYVALFLHGGFRWIPIDFEAAAEKNHQSFSGDGREPIKNPYFGLGVKTQFPNSSRFLPYLSASFDFNWWHLNETDTYCYSYWYYWCGTYNVYEFSPGFSGRAGSSVYLGNGMYVDLGLNVSMTFEGQAFDGSKYWLEPFVGILRRM